MKKYLSIAIVLFLFSSCLTSEYKQRRNLILKTRLVFVGDTFAPIGDDTEIKVILEERSPVKYQEIAYFYFNMRTLKIKEEISVLDWDYFQLVINLAKEEARKYGGDVIILGAKTQTVPSGRFYHGSSFEINFYIGKLAQ